jgi:beta-barrel assembly-enhancing protease
MEQVIFDPSLRDQPRVESNKKYAMPNIQAWRWARDYRGYLPWLLAFGWLGSLAIPGQAQDFDRYQRIQPQAPLPPEVYLSSDEHWRQVMGERGNLSPSERRFIREYTFSLRQLFLSGKVLFNDPLSQYVGEVGRYLLRDQPRWRDSLRFYVVRSPAPNAFTAHNGVILVNMGLLAQLENEAQLAFVLAHEISHFLQRHPLEVYLASQAIDAQTSGLFGRLSDQEAVLAKNYYSQEKEEEADSLGLQLYLQAGYGRAGVTGALRMLTYRDVPFGKVAFSPAFFEQGRLQLPAAYRLEVVEQTPAGPSPAGEARSTHPAPAERSRRLLPRLQNSQPGPLAWVDSQQFAWCRQVSRFECCLLEVQQQQYEKSFFDAYQLLQTYPNSRYLHGLMAYSLYALAKYANAGRFWDVHRDHETAPPLARPLHYLLEKLTPQELTVLALHQQWVMSQAYPQMPLWEACAKELMWELGRYHLEDTVQLVRVAPPPDSLSQPGSLVKYGLADLLQDPVWGARLARQLRQGREARELARVTTAAPPQATLALEGINLGLKRLVLVAPTFQHIDERRLPSLDVRLSVKKQQEMRDLLVEQAEEIGLELLLLDPDQLQAGDIERFREMVLLQEWLAEGAIELAPALISLQQAEAEALAQQYGTPYFAWLDAVALTRQRQSRVVIGVVGVLLPPALPFALHYLLTPEHRLLLYLTAFDLPQSSYLTLYPRVVELKDRPDVLHSTLYDLLYQLHQEP